MLRWRIKDLKAGAKKRTDKARCQIFYPDKKSDNRRIAHKCHLSDQNQKAPAIFLFLAKPALKSVYQQNRDDKNGANVGRLHLVRYFYGGTNTGQTH